ncbi:preprotein translocase subunit SecA [Chryseobacterium sp. Leaf180]|uniref:YchJ family protein n=1 Tax=Chryseobacterium sp. Leaf180 TaxID=1736289 RepID=UPI0006FCFB84|nr:YchJ family protein [Chryseobacterium sp. Leaf180]KQR93603.1 preprotein translocase subunit SecA [Chryseobacterium sp. Leaf180]
MNCPCCSGKSYEDCCQPFHLREKFPQTAESLMRSRFSAFALPNGAYLMETTLPEKRKFHDQDELQNWGESNSWKRLEIIKKPAENMVQFKAYYTDENGVAQIHHELSLFKKVDKRWFYVSGEFLD